MKLAEKLPDQQPVARQAMGQGRTTTTILLNGHSITLTPNGFIILID